MSLIYTGFVVLGAIWLLLVSASFRKAALIFTALAVALVVYMNQNVIGPHTIPGGHYTTTRACTPLHPDNPFAGPGMAVNEPPPCPPPSVYVEPAPQHHAENVQADNEAANEAFNKMINGASNAAPVSLNSWSCDYFGTTGEEECFLERPMHDDE